jgi:NAD(P)-dependent dehydrogenase (short-subunit alcohol dehydrogenase family)
MNKQTIIIAGGSNGIGIETARLFLNNGDNVVLNLPKAERTSRAYNELNGGENLAIINGSTTDRITGIKLLATAIARFGAADVLVNSIGDHPSRPFFLVDEAYLDRYMDTNLKGIFFITQGVIPQMIKQGNGTVINIDAPLISPSRETDPSSKLPYKGIIHSLTLQLAAEFEYSKIRFNTITPDHYGAWKSRPESSNQSGQYEDIAQIAYDIAKGKINGYS